MRPADAPPEAVPRHAEAGVDDKRFTSWPGSHRTPEGLTGAIVCKKPWQRLRSPGIR